MLSEIPAGLAEDVVRGKVRLAGGGALLPGLASRIETAAGIGAVLVDDPMRSEEHTSELQSQSNLVCRLLLEKKKKIRVITLDAANIIVDIIANMIYHRII